MAEVLIAHDMEEIAFAELLEVRLTKARHEATLESRIPDAGIAWQEKLDQAIRKSDIMVVVMTPKARASARITYEWAFALGAGVRVVPVELKPTPFHPRLEVLKRLDFTERQRPWEAFMEEIETAAGPTTTIPVPPDAPAAVTNAIIALDSLDIEDQVEGVQSLARMDHPDAREALAKALEHPVRTVRMTAAREFPDRNDPRSIPGLLDYFRKKQDQRQWIENRITSMGTPAVPYLLAALHDPHVNVRSLAALISGRIGDRESLSPLIGLLKDYSQWVRREAARALGRIGEASAVPHLIEILNDEDENVRAAAIRALGRIGHNAVSELLAALEDDSIGVRAAAAEALAESRVHSAVPDLVAHLRKDSSKVRTAAARALGRLGDPTALPPLMEAFQDKTDRHGITRRPAAQAMGLLGDQRAVEALLPYLAGRQDEANWNPDHLDFAVAEALLKLRSTESIDIVGKTLGRFRSGTPPMHIVELLGSFGDDAVPALQGLLDHRSFKKRPANMLKEIGTPQALEALKQWRRSQ
jgi:HEAT repeat protein